MHFFCFKPLKNFIETVWTIYVHNALLNCDYGFMCGLLHAVLQRNMHATKLWGTGQTFRNVEERMHFFKPKEHRIFFFNSPKDGGLHWMKIQIFFILVKWFRPSLIAFWHTSLSFKRIGIAQVSVNSDCECHEEISLENTADFKGYLSVCIYTAMSQTNLTSNQSCNIITLPFLLCISFANLPDIDSTIIIIIIDLQYLCCLS